MLLNLPYIMQVLGVGQVKGFCYTQQHLTIILTPFPLISWWGKLQQQGVGGVFPVEKWAMLEVVPQRLRKEEEEEVGADLLPLERRRHTEGNYFYMV